MGRVTPVLLAAATALGIAWWAPGGGPGKVAAGEQTDGSDVGALPGAAGAETAAARASDHVAAPPWLQPPSPPVVGPPLPQVPATPSARWPQLGRVATRSLPVFHSAARPKYQIGELRLGGLVRLSTPDVEPEAVPCPEGWLAVEPRGLVCPEPGALRLGTTPPPITTILPPPHPRAVVPHRYVKVSDRGAYRFDQLPTAQQRAAVRAGVGDVRRELGARPLDGAYFLAIEKTVERADGQTFLQTHEGNFVHPEVTEAMPASQLVGARIEDPQQLPLAFVTAPSTPVRSARGGVLVGHADRYARVPLAGAGRPDADGRVRTADGYLLPAEDVRIVRRAARPSSIPASARWLQVDHAAQTLLMYDADRPVYASLVSSGKPGRRTPSGVHRVQHKHLTVTMRGQDPDGPYEVQAVPWALYYDGPYAIHGAYWHDGFGATRSHGCTNLAPADARHVFRFMRPSLPAGLHSGYEPGSYVHMRRSG